MDYFFFAFSEIKSALKSDQLLVNEKNSNETLQSNSPAKLIYQRRLVSLV